MFRVLQESLMNVYRHAHAHKGTVRVWRDQDRVLLEVQDDGVGIPQRKLARFNRDGGGMGVGLTGIWERVSDAGGKAELLSGPKGTTVRICIPSEQVIIPSRQAA
jgi:signal transduction histidine kinase